MADNNIRLASDPHLRRWMMFIDGDMIILPMIVTQAVASITRPANTTTYTPGDVITDDSNSRLVFSLLNRYGTDAMDGYEIKSAVCVSNANQVTDPDLELWLFVSDPRDLAADNAAFAPTDAELESLAGIVKFPVASFVVGNAGSGISGNVACIATNIGIAADAPTLFGVLVVRNAYVPVSAEKFQVTLQVVKSQN